MNIKFNVAIDCCLKSFTCDSCETEIDEFVIPAKVGDNKVSAICRLGNSFDKLKKQDGVKKIKRLVIEEGIKEIEGWAFANIEIEIDEVVLPDSCEEIHFFCFYNTSLGGIQGIDHVKKIGECAFAHTKLKNITWPVNCERIPVDCFCYSTIEAIIFPSGGIRDIDLYDLDLACRESNIKKIDLSEMCAVNFIKGHPGVDYQKLYDEMKEILCLPYYVTRLE